MDFGETVFEFHISSLARDRYDFDERLCGVTGNVIFVNIDAVRAFAYRINRKRDLAGGAELAVKPGDLYAMGLIDEILHLVVALYREEVQRDAMASGLAWLIRAMGHDRIEEVITRFASLFPTVAVYQKHLDVHEYLRGDTGGIPNRQIVLEEMLLLSLANENPAFRPFRELFDDAELRHAEAYPELFTPLHDFFDTLPGFGPDGQNLIDLLRAPALNSPDSLDGQLQYILDRWGGFLGSQLQRLLRGLDLIREERKLPFLGPGESQVYDYTPLRERGALRGEREAFSPDLDWMPSIVLIAKNIYVWLDQLSRKYSRDIRRLDQIPDEELARLASWGFTGLWLIGVWERSQASQRIKQLCGNPEAVPSAYSLHDYTIAFDLGGQPAYDHLRERAWSYGLRMATDMVPNHVGISSRWMVEHPDWFVSLDYNPYPWYTYGGPDLSEDERVGVFIEDHYYDRTDAAVVFRRLDRWTGSEKYIYHGNDGTSMPWNDTAQLNYLNPELREAVIQTILHVARQFPVIRFDAAMTLTKLHYQRLWYPEPGSGGAIPTRSEHGLTVDQFDAAMPNEFWREVVDRVAAEAPDTLLLAEAFWLLEGYFVRTLGMHRVYNSAFMNMLRDEENAKYRQVIKNTIEFDPEVLRRFVNFMNNPDERTAVDQFGKDDKYIGICTLMVTMPGLPMFGHGQIEGFTEKYGMEYRRAYWDEQPDEQLIRRHEREIFPLVKQRRLFAGVDEFRLYDFFRTDGSVDENVFAYSNRSGSDRAVVLYHNRYAETAGWLRLSAGFAVKSEGGESAIHRTSLADGLGLPGGDGKFVIFRDQVTGLEYLRRCDEVRDQGLYVEMGAYQRHVFVEFREVQESALAPCGELARSLDGRGVPSVDQALGDLVFHPVREAFWAVVNASTLRAAISPDPAAVPEELQRKLALEERLLRLLEQVGSLAGGDTDAPAAIAHAIGRLEVIRTPGVLPEAPAGGAASLDERAVVTGWALAAPVSEVAGGTARNWLVDWGLSPALRDAFEGLAPGDRLQVPASSAVAVLLARGDAIIQATLAGDAQAVLEGVFLDLTCANWLGVNSSGGVVWFNKERFELFLESLVLASRVEAFRMADAPPGSRDRRLANAKETYREIEARKEASGWRVNDLLQDPVRR